MALQIKSQGRGTARFQISGIQDSLYRAYSLVARRRRMSLNALLQEAVEEYMTARHEETWKECAEPENTDEEILTGIKVPIPMHELDAEIERRAILKAKEIVEGGSGKTPSRPPQLRPQPPPSNIRDDSQAGTAQKPYERKPWNKVAGWPGPPPGYAEREAWEAAGRPDEPTWLAARTVETPTWSPGQKSTIEETER